jgi:hypothetical protein
MRRQTTTTLGTHCDIVVREVITVVVVDCSGGGGEWVVERRQ